MNHWRNVSKDPDCAHVSNYLQEKLTNILGKRITNFNLFLDEFVTNYSVLDIGVVAHIIEKTNSCNWRHGNIKAKAKNLVGIDIIEDAVIALNNSGYDVRIIDATSDVDIGERFQRIVIGDVIEHVDSPVALLRFASRHLSDDGLIVCTTPNPLYIGNYIGILRKGFLIVNAEHTCWITPTNALELAHRAEVSLQSYHHLSGSGNTLFRKIGIGALKLLGLIKYEFFARSYIYVFAKK